MPFGKKSYIRRAIAEEAQGNYSQALDRLEKALSFESAKAVGAAAEEAIR